MITAQQADILDHTIYRAAGGFYCGGGKTMSELVAIGLMQSARRKSFVPEEYFTITRAGRETLTEWRAAQPQPAKSKRSPRSRVFEAWRNYCDGDPRISFSNFWKETWPSLRYR